MNTKRQTIWLVSMLSLMVVLSAYYLFTNDSNSPDLLTDGTQTEQGTNQNATSATAGSTEIVPDAVVQTKDNSELSPADKEVLEQLETQGTVISSEFAEAQLKRTQQYDEESNKLLAVIANTQKNTQEQVTEAAKQLDLLEEKNTKLTGLEEELMKDFHTAIIDEQNNQYKVLVESEKLEKSQAADIIDLVMTTMEVRPDQVSVQYVP